jgi:hypothetical protein
MAMKVRGGKMVPLVDSSSRMRALRGLNDAMKGLDKAITSGDGMTPKEMMQLRSIREQLARLSGPMAGGVISGGFQI